MLPGRGGVGQYIDRCITALTNVLCEVSDIVFAFIACRQCTEGLIRCHGLLTAQTCCNYFDFAGSCVEECPTNSRPNSTANECECNPGYMLNAMSCMVIDECGPFVGG